MPNIEEKKTLSQLNDSLFDTLNNICDGMKAGESYTELQMTTNEDRKDFSTIGIRGDDFAIIRTTYSEDDKGNKRPAIITYCREDIALNITKGLLNRMIVHEADAQTFTGQDLASHLGAIDTIEGIIVRLNEIIEPTKNLDNHITKN